LYRKTFQTQLSRVYHILFAITLPDCEASLLYARVVVYSARYNCIHYNRLTPVRATLLLIIFHTETLRLRGTLVCRLTCRRAGCSSCRSLWNIICRSKAAARKPAHENGHQGPHAWIRKVFCFTVKPLSIVLCEFCGRMSNWI